MASIPDELIAGLNLLKVTGEPIFEDLKIIRRLLNSNSMSVSSYKACGRHGRLGLIMTNAEYFAVANDVFLPPDNSGPAVTIIRAVTTVQIAEEQAVKKMSINAFEDLFLNALSDEIVGYVNCTSLQLLSHLLMY
jgi:hypothetical protein